MTITDFSANAQLHVPYLSLAWIKRGFRRGVRCTIYIWQITRCRVVPGNNLGGGSLWYWTDCGTVQTVLFLICILSTSLTSVSIFSFWWCSRYLSLWATYNLCAPPPFFVHRLGGLAALVNSWYVYVFIDPSLLSESRLLASNTGCISEKVQYKIVQWVYYLRLFTKQSHSKPYYVVPCLLTYLSFGSACFL